MNECSFIYHVRICVSISQLISYEFVKSDGFLGNHHYALKLLIVYANMEYPFSIS